MYFSLDLTVQDLFHGFGQHTELFLSGRLGRVFQHSGPRATSARCPMAGRPYLPIAQPAAHRLDRTLSGGLVATVAGFAIASAAYIGRANRGGAVARELGERRGPIRQLRMRHPSARCGSASTTRLSAVSSTTRGLEPGSTSQKACLSAAMRIGKLRIMLKVPASTPDRNGLMRVGWDWRWDWSWRERSRLTRLPLTLAVRAEHQPKHEHRAEDEIRTHPTEEHRLDDLQKPTATKENAKAIEAAPTAIGNHLPPLVLRRCARAVCNANAPTLAAITVNSSDTGRKLNRPSTSGETMIASKAASAKL